MAAKTHAHVDMPSDAELARLIEAKFPAHRQLYLDAHRLVMETIPGVRYSVDCEDGAIGYAQRQFGYDGWGMAALTPYAGWVSLGFLNGAELDDAAGILEGSGALVRHVKIRSSEELAVKREDVRALLVAAAKLNEE